MAHHSESIEKNIYYIKEYKASKKNYFIILLQAYHVEKKIFLGKNIFFNGSWNHIWLLFFFELVFICLYNILKFYQNRLSRSWEFFIFLFFSIFWFFQKPVNLEIWFFEVYRLLSVPTYPRSNNLIFARGNFTILIPL